LAKNIWTVAAANILNKQSWTAEKGCDTAAGRVGDVLASRHLKQLTLRRLMSYIYIYGAPILDVSRSHTTTQHSR